MGWLGKIVGGTIGFALGGPLGAVAGAAFGHAYDKFGDFDGLQELPQLSNDEQGQLTFFVAAFSMLAKMARADGHVSQAEIATIERFMTQELRLTPQSRNVAVNIFQTALNSPARFEDYAAQFYNQFRFQPQILEFMLDILLRVASADGTLSPAEEAMLKSAARQFGFGEARFQTFRSRYGDDIEKDYAVLGCQRSDSMDTIKSAYRQRVHEFHPDKITAKGLPEEFTRFAEEKFREIQEAWEKVKADKGEG